MLPPHQNTTARVADALAGLPDIIDSLNAIDFHAMSRIDVPRDQDTDRAHPPIGPMTSLAEKARHFGAAADTQAMGAGLVTLSEIFDKGYNLFKSQKRFTQAANEMRGIMPNAEGGARANLLSAREYYRSLGGPVPAQEFTHADMLDDARQKYEDAVDTLKRQGMKQSGVGHIHGPFQQLTQAKTDFQNAINFGDEDIIKDASFNLKVAKEKVEGIDKKRGFGMGMSAFMARNMGMLMGYSAGLIGGPGGGAGRAAIGLMAPMLLEEGALNPTNLALAALGTAALHAAAGLNETAKTSYLLGSSSPADAFALNAMGIPMQQQASVAAKLHELLSQDPFAITASRGIGGPGFVAPRPFGGADEGNLLRTHLALLRTYGQEHGQLEMLNRARMLHLEGYSAELLASEDVYQMRQNIARHGSDLQSPEDRQAAIDAEQSFKAAQDTFGMSMTQLGKAFLPIATFGTTIAAGFGTGLSYALQGAEDIFSLIGGLITNDLSGEVKKDQVQDKHTEALNRHADALNQAYIMQPGTYGGGPRTHGAIPPALKGELFREAAAGGTLSFGAWSIS